MSYIGGLVFCALRHCTSSDRRLFSNVGIRLCSALLQQTVLCMEDFQCCYRRLPNMLLILLWRLSVDFSSFIFWIHQLWTARNGCWKILLASTGPVILHAHCEKCLSCQNWYSYLLTKMVVVLGKKKRIQVVLPQDTCHLNYFCLLGINLSSAEYWCCPFQRF